MTVRLLNDITWELASAITSTSATTLTVTSYTGTSALTTFPSTGTTAAITIRIDDELMLLTSWSGTTFTVTRGIEGTTAATHVSGSEVDAILTIGSLDARIYDQCLSDTEANKPAAGSNTGNPGRLYFPTDGYHVERDSGGSEADSWHAFGPVFPMVRPPGSSAWTQMNVASNAANPVVSYEGGCPSIHVAIPTTSGQNVIGLYQAQPATPYTVTASFLYGFVPGAISRELGLFWRDSSGQILSHALELSEFNPALVGLIWTNPTTYSGTNLRSTLGTHQDNIRFFRLSNDGTTLRASISGDGINFYEVYNDPVGSHITPNGIGFFINPQGGAGYGVGIRLIHWQIN